MGVHEILFYVECVVISFNTIIFILPDTFDVSNG